MDQFDFPTGGSGDEIGPVGILTYLLALTLSLATSLICLSNIVEAGPEVGEMVTFDPGNGPKHWDQPGIPAQRTASPNSACILMPSVMSTGGGSFVIEAKDLTSPPLFQVHWSGAQTAVGVRDCGRSADLVLTLIQLRALANIAGGFGATHGIRSLWTD
jgi:hypothetical protein